MQLLAMQKVQIPFPIVESSPRLYIYGKYNSCTNNNSLIEGSVLSGEMVLAESGICLH
jgi:hypothetical protein